MHSCKNISSFLDYYTILKGTCIQLLIVHTMPSSATSKQQKILPASSQEQLIHANSSLHFNGRYIRVLNLYLSLLITCLCVGSCTHTLEWTSINMQCVWACVKICGSEVKYPKRLIHPCSLLKKFEVQRLFEKCYSFSSSFTAFI